MSLTKQRLRELTQLTDPLGVVSIYATIDTTQEASQRPTWWLKTYNALDELRARVKRDGPRELDMAVRDRLDGLVDDLDWLLEARLFGLGRALFVALSTGRVERVAMQMPLGTRVVCEEKAYVRPLLDAWADGSPAGIAVAGADGLRMVDLRFGVAEEVADLRFELDTSEWTELKGPAVDNPAQGRRVAPQYDLFDRRVEQHLKKFLIACGGSLRTHTRQHGWEFLVVAGEPKLREAVTERLGDHFPAELVTSAQVIGPATANRIAEAVSADLAAARLRRDHALADRVAGSKLSAQGVDQTLAAVQQGQAEMVLMSRDGRWSGSRSADGQFVAAGVRAPGTDGDHSVPEPDLAERIIELALDHDSRLVMLHPEAAERIPDSEGLAAMLRW